MTGSRSSRAVVTAALGCMALLLGACADGSSRPRSPALVSEGNAEVGREVIVETGCGSCHRIPGIPNANALVGPPLDSWSRRSFIAGTLSNNEENLSRWLADPQEIRPGSAMPDLDLSDDQVADVVAYLFTLS
ncbi:MAG: c-type cytochrome [Acidimicrobiales bacterium]